MSFPVVDSGKLIPLRHGYHASYVGFRSVTDVTNQGVVPGRRMMRFLSSGPGFLASDMSFTVMAPNMSSISFLSPETHMSRD